MFANPLKPLKCNISPPDEDILPDTLKSSNEDDISENCMFVLYSVVHNCVTAEANAGIDATRRTEYLSWDKQMEMIYKDQKNGTTTFKDHCDKVRSDNPK